MADNEDPKGKSALKPAAKPAVKGAQTAPLVQAKPDLAATKKSEPAIPAKPADTAPVVPAPAATSAIAASAAKTPATAAQAASAQPPSAKPVAAKVPVATKPAVAAKAPAAVPASVKAEPASKPKAKIIPAAQAKPAPVASVVPAPVAAAQPAMKVAKDVKSASAPDTSPKAATPQEAPKTASTKPVFAGLFPNFMLEETNMDMSANFAGLQGAMTEAQAKAKAAFEKSTAAMGEVTEFTKGNVEACVESGKIFAEGCQGLGSEIVAESRTAFETMTGDIKELAAAKSPTDFFKIQSEMVRKNFDSAVAYSSKNSEAMLKLFNDSFAPISGRMSIAMDKARSASF